MSQTRDEAEALAMALEIGACGVVEVIAWSDAQLLREQSPPGALCEVSLAHDRYPQDVASMLRQLPGTPERSNVVRLLVTLLNDKLTCDVGRAGQIASALYQLALADDIQDSPLRDTAWWAWDALDLAEAGITQESREQVVSQMANALAGAAAGAEGTWSFRVGTQETDY